MSFDHMLGFNLHPIFSGFPLAFFLLLILFELLALKRNWAKEASLVALTLTCLGVLLAFFSGYQGHEFANQTHKVPEETIVWHHNLGRILLFATVALCCLGWASAHAKFHRTIFRSVYIGILLICLGLTVYVGFLGGELVFKYGAGVKVEGSINKAR